MGKMLGPSLILFSLELLAVGSAWFALWLMYLLFVIRDFPKVQTAPENYGRGEPRRAEPRVAGSGLPS